MCAVPPRPAPRQLHQMAPLNILALDCAVLQDELHLIVIIHDRALSNPHHLRVLPAPKVALKLNHVTQVVVVRIWQLALVRRRVSATLLIVSKDAHALVAIRQVDLVGSNGVHSVCACVFL